MKKLTALLHREYFLWFIAGCLIAARFIVMSLLYPNEMNAVFREYYFELLIGVVVAVFPFVYYQIFSAYPLQSIRKKDSAPSIVVQGNENVVHISKEDSIKTDYEQIEGGIGLLTQLVANAEDLSNKIYRRYGVYLVFGVLIAFSGILYFSFQSISVTENQDFKSLLLTLAPRFGILFFMEFIAFFFLKQYRAAMDEFRHYDSIRRNRESQLALYMIASRDFKEADFSKVVDKMGFFDRVGVLSQGETTEIIEASKINKNELETAKEFLIEIVNIARQGDKKSQNNQTNKDTSRQGIG
uniref:Uncharacterized protein n=1 Tax=Candidatus Kentrum sp. MB TaxID=2138164 RepID=A0A451BFY3_9GAMM|nr:MAG: hypothetical protein BECKMB1821I_GA0114274_11043 [Candidatus Kentron sp. MB]VFK77188.1 MAG: hypothetical protein BECKMB1821H_GA0114242_11083 [Candidatus Kentron sp. MB]